MSEEENLKVLNGIKSLINQLPNMYNSSTVIRNLEIDGYGNGQNAYNLLKNEFDELDNTKIFKILDLDKEIRKQKREIKNLELKHTNLTEIIGDIANGGSEGSITNQLLINLKTEIEQLINKRDALTIEVSEKKTAENDRALKQKEKENTEENNFNIKIETLKNKYKEEENKLELEFDTKTTNINKKIKEAEENANAKVKLINQFRDFLEETNKNMKLYTYVIIGVLLAAIFGIGFSIPNLLKSFNSFEIFIENQNLNITNWKIITFSLGLFIVKLPWALCLSAVLTGMYSLLKGLLLTYEKINQDKRNMSAIYAISGNIAVALNEYGMSLVEDRKDAKSGSIEIIPISIKDLDNKKETLRWNQIMKYFEGMQNNKVEIETTENQSQTKLLSGILEKVIEKIPTK